MCRSRQRLLLSPFICAIRSPARMEGAAGRSPSTETASSRALMNAMGRFMMQGYTMTSQHCPLCTTVLLRSRDGELYCSKCNAPVVAGDDDSVASATATRPAAASSPSTATRTTTATTNTVVAASASVTSPSAAAASPSKSDGKRTLAPRDVAAQRLGQRLIQGWKMLEDSCDVCNTPWMAHRSSPRKFCVLCDEWQDVLASKGSSTAAAAAPAAVVTQPVLAASVETAAVTVEDAPSRGVVESKEEEAPAAPAHAGDKAASMGLLSHLRRYAEQDDDDDDEGDARYADADDEAASNAAATASAAAPPVVDFIAALDAAEDDEEAIRIQLRRMRGAAAPAPAPSADTTNWASALNEVHAGIHADAAHGPSARVLTHAQQLAQTSGTLPPHADAVPVFGAVRVMDAPAGWANMTREQLNAYAAGTAGTAPSASTSAAAATAPAADTAAEAGEKSLIARAREMQDGASVSLGARDGNIGPSGRVVLMQKNDITIPEPDAARVRAMAAALQMAEQAELEQAAVVAPTPAAAVPAPTPAATAAAPVVAKTAPVAAMTAPPPVGVNAAIAALSAHLAAENARMIALISTCADGSATHGEESVSIIAARVARCADALRALHALQSVQV